MSPPLVVAFALAGRVDLDLSREPIGKGKDGAEVHLRDLWPTLAEVRTAMESALRPEVFRRLYSDFANQNPKWNEIPAAVGDTYAWDRASTYIQEPPFFADFGMAPGTIGELRSARALGIFGDSVTTDHISPAGAIKKMSPAGHYLNDHGVAFEDFNSYGSRRGNDRVMTRGTFANVRIKNLMVPEVEGGVTKFHGAGHSAARAGGALPIEPGSVVPIYDAAMAYQMEGTPLMIFSGQEYGTGSSRDWAAKGTRLLGVRAVVAQSFERIHRSNLCGMGVIPLQFPEGVNAQTLNLVGSETFDLLGLSDALKPMSDVTLVIHRTHGAQEKVTLRSRIDTAIEVDYVRHGGILPYVLRQLLAAK
jgi:aconitate hydratase